MTNERIQPNETEATINRVLAGLRDVGMPQGMEQRVLEAAERRAARPEPTAHPWLGSRRWAFAGAALVALLLAAPLALRKRKVPQHDEIAVTQHATQQVAGAAAIAEEQPTSKVQPATVSILPHTKDKDAADFGDLNDLDALAIAEMNAPSKPAPPLPLTPQEKLLAEAAHPDSAIEVSSLRPEIRAQQMELSKAEFHDFFDLPPVKGNE